MYMKKNIIFDYADEDKWIIYIKNVKCLFISVDSKKNSQQISLKNTHINFDD